MAISIWIATPVFAVKNSLIRDFTLEAPGIAPDGKKIDTPWRKLQTDFVLCKTANYLSANGTVTEPAAPRGPVLNYNAKSFHAACCID